MLDREGFRPNVGIILLNARNEVFWGKRVKEHAWQFPQGGIKPGETPEDAMYRELEEETGLRPEGNFLEMAPVKQTGGKTVFAWAVEWDCDPANIRSHKFAMEWPKGSGQMREFPEIDRAEWFSIEVARVKLLKGQSPFLDQLERVVGK